MGYLFLMLSLFSGTAKGYCGKRISSLTDTFHTAVTVNVIRMGLCAVISALLLVTTPNGFVLTTPIFLTSLLSGVSMSLFVITWLLSVRRGAYMMLDVFLMLGVAVPIVLSGVIFSEVVKTSQLIGLLLLLVSVFFMCSYNNSVKARITPTSFLLLAVCGVSSGVMDFSGKLFVKLSPDAPVATFNLYTYIFALCVLVLLFLFAKREGGIQTADLKRGAGYVVIMSACMFLNVFFKTKSAVFLDSVILYPLSQGGSLILSSVMATTLFREKLTIKAVVGIALSFVSLLIINLL